MSILKEKFDKVKKTVKKMKKLEKEKAAMELLYKDDEVFKKYMKILQGLDDTKKELKEANGYMYDVMLDENQKTLECDDCTITLKKPYTKTVLNSKAFLEDNKVGSKLYNKYVSVQEVKGNVTITVIDK